MSPRIFESFEAKHARLWSRYTVKLRHRLHESLLFSDEGLAGLIDAIPPSHMTINTMAPDRHNLESWSYCDRDGLSGRDVLEVAKHGRLWINMRKIHEVDSRFAEILDGIYDELASHMPDFQTFKRSLGLLISSPKAQVFYHADVPGQSLWQLRGRKRIYIYPEGEPFLRPADLENIIRGITEEEVPYQTWFDDYATAYDLEPGDMVHWKLNGPHRVVNQDCLNVSITTEHWEPAIRRNFAMNYGNGVLRRNLGWEPRSRAVAGPAFWGKVALTALWRASGLQQRAAFKRTNRYRIDPTAQDGIVPINAVPAE